MKAYKYKIENKYEKYPTYLVYKDNKPFGGGEEIVEMLPTKDQAREMCNRYNKYYGDA